MFVLYGVWSRGHERVSAFAKDWWPVFGVLLVYENLKHMHANRITEWLGISPKDRLMLDIDEMLFGKTLSLYFDAPIFTGFFSEVMWFFYVWAYYLSPVVLLGYAYFIREDQLLFERLRRALIIGLLGGYVLYLLVPVAGPLFLIGEKFQNPILTQPFLRRLVFSTLRFNWDCFPSLHTAIPWLLAAVVWSDLQRRGKALVVIVASGVTLSTVTLRFHYGIDVIAGWLWAAIVWFVLNRLRSFNPTWSITLPRFSRDDTDAKKLPLLVLGCLFVFTGVVGLLAEQAFEKLLVTLLGASTPAAATVLAVYFLGLTIGGALYGPLIRARNLNPLRVYACLEAGVAIWSLLLYLCYGHLITLFAPLLALGKDSAVALGILRLLVAMLWILPPTVLMGASFPAIVDALDAMRAPTPRKAMAKFYTLNLTGAFIGALLGPYIAFPRWGVDGTLLFAYIVDAGVAFAALHLAKHSASPGVAIAANPSAVAPPWRNFFALLIVSFGSGFLFFSLEVVWTHLIGAVLGNSVYAFAAMLALVLAGLGLGGAVIARIFPEGAPIPVWGLSLVLLVGAELLVWQYGQWPEVPHRFTLWGGDLDTFGQGELLRWAQAGLLLLPAAFVFGVIYPSLFRIRWFPEKERSVIAGRVSAVNSVGCILGALVTGFVLIPTIGSGATLKLLGFTAVICALLLGVYYLRSLPTKFALAAASAAIAAQVGFQAPWDELALTSGEHVYFARNQVWPQSRLKFFHEDTLGGITTVVENPAGVRGQSRPYLTLLTNGKFQGNDAWESAAQTGFALVPILHTERRDAAMVIGLGTGHSAAVVNAFGFRRIDIAEISPGIVKAAKEYFPHINDRILESPHVRLALEDGRNRLLLHSDRYDLITMEISSVWFVGSTNLYSQEFYKLVRKRLNPDGVFQQWIQLHHIGETEVASVIATMRSVFPYVSFWRVGGQGILLGSDRPQLMRKAAMETFLEIANKLDVPPGTELSFLKGIVLSRLLAPVDVARLPNKVPFPINTDANRFLEYATPRYNLSKDNHAARNLIAIARHASFPRPMVDSLPTGELGTWLAELDKQPYLKHFKLEEATRLSDSRH